MKFMSRWTWVLLLVVVSGCAVYATQDLDQSFGQADLANREKHSNVDASFYQEQVKPILENRCINCHACYDAPCQIKLTAPGGIERGGSKALVYEGNRLLASEPTRLFEDARTTEEWRDKGFYSILNEREQSPAANLQGSILYRAVALRRQQGDFEHAILPPDEYDFSLNRDQVCPAVEEYSDFEQSHASWGMPYGLPQLTDQEYNVLTKWLVQGGKMSAPATLPETIEQSIKHWEKRFNGDSLKAQLVNRYIYEHIYLYSLYFDEQAKYRFKLVRSSTPPGQPIDRIATRRPYEAPGVDRVYYRLWLDPESVVQKTNIPMQLDDARYQRWHRWFYDVEYQVTHKPGYEVETASNPFVTFEEIPANSRYRFLLDHAQNTIMAFIKGPVCRGQIAVNVINEQFWVYFVNPDLELHNVGSEFLRENASALSLPASLSSNALPIASWVSYAEKQKNYLSSKAGMIEELEKGGIKMTPELIWDGEGDNTNAALTIMRHFDNASVERGNVGPTPKTAWVIDYPLLERIHYLLVAGFDVFGNVGHQLVTRLYMDFLRMEGEMNFLLFLPKDERQAVRQYWYRDADQTIKDYIFSDMLKVDVDSGIAYQTDDHKAELLAAFAEHLGSALETKHDIDTANLHATSRQALQQLQKYQGNSVTFFPEFAVLLIERDGASQALMSLVHNRAHSNITSLLDEESTLLPEEDTLVITNGLVGDYPNVILRIDEQRLPAFVEQVGQLKSEQDYNDLLDRFGVRRTSADFWKVSDEIRRLNSTKEPISSGILDYNRLQNR